MEYIKEKNAEIYMNYNFWLNHILIIQKKKNLYLHRKRVEITQTHSLQYFSYYKNIAHSDNVAQITGFL